MASTEYRRLLDQAKEQALLCFAASVRLAAEEAGSQVTEALVVAYSAHEQARLASVRQLLREGIGSLVGRMEAAYRTYLDRAFQTMYTDLRPSMRKVSIDELTLIEDEVVNQQIEVSRLSQRLRDANEAAIGRLNVIVANLHGQTDARERENPFRPHPIARAVFQVVSEVTADPSKQRLLFEHLSDALVSQMGMFYITVSNVFDGAGLKARYAGLKAEERKPVPSHAEASGNTQVHFPDWRNTQLQTDTISPLLQQLAHGVAQRKTRPTHSVGVQGQVAGWQSPAMLRANAQAEFLNTRRLDEKWEAVANLLPQLTTIQRTAFDVAQSARMQNDAEQISNGFPALFGDEVDARNAVLDVLDVSTLDQTQQIALDVISVVFDQLHGDDTIPAAARNALLKLEAPFLKLVLLDESILTDETHPARRFLNTLCMNAAGVSTDAKRVGLMAKEVERTVSTIANEFERDVSIFDAACVAFTSNLGSSKDLTSDYMQRAMSALTAAEHDVVVLANIEAVLTEKLRLAGTSEQVAALVLSVWPAMLMVAARRDAREQGNLLEPIRTLLPELLWSVQGNHAHERSELLRMLPGLVRRMHAALQMTLLASEAIEAKMDLLLDMHTKVLHGDTAPTPQQLGLQELRTLFGSLEVLVGSAPWAKAKPPELLHTTLAWEAAVVGVQWVALLETAKPIAPWTRASEFNQWQVGTRVSWQLESGKREMRCLHITPHQSGYLFESEDGELFVFSSAVVRELSTSGALRTVHYRPPFERAIEALLQS